MKRTLPVGLLTQYMLMSAVAVIGLERLNVVPSSGSYVQLFYLLALPFLWVILQRQFRNLLTAYVALMIMAALTLLANEVLDFYYWKKFILLGFVLAATFGVAAYIHQKNHEMILVRGLQLFVLLNLITVLLQLLAFMQREFLSIQLDPARYINFDAVVIGDYFRPSGYSFDANKGLFNISYALISLTLLSKDGWGWMKRIYPLTFFAHSRSTLLAIFPALFAKSKIYAISSVFVYVVIMLFLTPQPVIHDRLACTDSAEQTFNGSCSNSFRLELMTLWLNGMSSSSVKQMVFGHGIGSSGTYLSNSLNTNYGDFANGYLTYVYEFGLLGIFILGYIFARLWRAYDSTSRKMLLASLMIFQLFYSNLAEPLIIMALTYIYLRSQCSSKVEPLGERRRMI